MNIFFREILPFINIVYQPENSLLIIIITIFGFIYKPEFYRKSKNCKKKKKKMLTAFKQFSHKHSSNN